MSFTGWIASLDNGETIKQFDEEGKTTSWQGLLKFCKETGVKIVQMRLQKDKVTLVSKPKADGYVQCTEVFISMYSGKHTEKRGIGFVELNNFEGNDLVYMLWIDDSNNIWQDTRELKELKLHAFIA